MFRGVVLKVSPTEADIKSLTFSPARWNASRLCASEAKEESWKCTCDCCCFTFELDSDEEAGKVPIELWNRPVVWRKIRNPIGINRVLPDGFDRKSLCTGDKQVFLSRIPYLNHHTFAHAEKLKTVVEISMSKSNCTDAVQKNKKMISKAPEGNEKDDSSIVVMGAGGIGCEVLKTLFLRGFHDFTVIDRDNIEVTNLNRQLLFSSKDVGRGKAEVSTEVLRCAMDRGAFYTSLFQANQGEFTEAKRQIRYHHGDIERFCVSKHDFSCFTDELSQSHDRSINALDGKRLCVSALDNVPTRQFINRICCEASVPIIESGVSGLNGQVQPICSCCGSACYDCHGIKRSQQQSFAVCTVHARPTKVLHCIHYAQQLHAFLLQALCGESSVAEEEKSEFDDLRAVLQSQPTGPRDTLRKVEKLFNFMCADRIIRKFEDSSSGIDETEPHEAPGAKRPREPVEKNCPSPISFLELTKSLQENEDITAQRTQLSLALILFVHAIMVYLGTVSGKDMSDKVLKANFIFSVTTFRCMVFRIDIAEHSMDVKSAEGYDSLLPMLSCAAQSSEEEEMSLDVLEKLSDLANSYGYIHNKAYMSIETTAMRIIPSVASANAILSAYAASLGVRLLCHRHSAAITTFANGQKISAASISYTGANSAFCENEVFRMIYMRAVPLQVKNRLVRTKPRPTVSMPIYSHRAYRANPKCVTCGRLTAKQCQRTVNVLADCSSVTLRDFVGCVADQFLRISFPVIDIAASGPNAGDRTYRTLYEAEDFEVNASEPLSKWVAQAPNSALQLVVSSTDALDAKHSVWVYHDVNKKLSKDQLILRYVE